MTINIVSTITREWKTFLYILMNSVKQNKKQDTVIDYTVMVYVDQSHSLADYSDFFADLESETFHVHVIPMNEHLDKIGDLPGNHIVYLRLLFSSIFHDLDKLLYLDADVLCHRPGIEELWSTDLTNRYVAACPDAPICYSDFYKSERENVGSDTYFNSGVMLFNLAYLRQSGMAETLEAWSKDWDQSIVKCIYHHDQTIFNYLFKGKIELLSSVYNNNVLTAFGYRVPMHEIQAAKDGYPHPVAMLDHTVFFHFCDRGKPWVDRLPFPETTYPYLKESREIWSDAVARYGKEDNTPVTVRIASASTQDYLWLARMLMQTIRDTKAPSTMVDYYLFVPFTADKGQEQCASVFADIENDTFRIHIVDAEPLMQEISPVRGTHMPKITYVRCLLPDYFKDFDKLLYLDIDILCLQKGIEQLWNTNIAGKYAAVAIDPVLYTTDYAAERRQVGTELYFNAGVLLLNLEQIRKDGISEELEQWMHSWDHSRLAPICDDQTLLNYLFHGNVVWLPMRFNNQSMTAWGFRVPATERLVTENGYQNPLDSLSDTVLLHFNDHDKPWIERLSLPDDVYPYRRQAKALWSEYVNRYGLQGQPAGRYKTTMYIATTVSVDLMDKIYILLNSLKHTKRPDTKVQYYLFVPRKDQVSFQEYLTGLPSEDFAVTIMDVDWFVDKVHCPQKGVFHYARCLFPKVFLNLDRILWLDADIVFKEPGIEDLWEMDFEDNYVAACIDPSWQWCPVFKHDLENTGTTEYINTGVLLMNLKKIREDGADDEIADWVAHWAEPDRQRRLLCHVYDQTLINYLWKGHIKLVNTRFNNSLLASLRISVDAYAWYMNTQGYIDPMDSLQNAVILHFCGSMKPWLASIRRLGTDVYPYKDTAIALWDKLSERYRKK